jgi:predicted  nucleic acid-binding Zn-ribbon protein
MSHIAFVNPDGLKTISKKIGGLSQDLANLSKQTNQKIENLYQSGFKDAQFIQLKSKIEESQDDIKNLIKLMDLFDNYIQEQEKLITAYLNTPKMKSGKL